MRAAIVAALAVRLVAVSPVAAQAQHPMDQGGSTSHFTHRHRNRPIARPCRVRMHRKHRSGSRCHGYVVSHASGRRRVTRKMLATYGRLRPRTAPRCGAYDRQAKAGGAVYWRTFWQNGMTVPGPTILYQEKHDGMGFWDGTHVWLDSPQGQPSDHSCYPTHEIGFDVQTDDCSEDLRCDSSNRPYMQYWCRWKVGFVWRACRSQRTTTCTSTSTAMAC